MDRMIPLAVNLSGLNDNVLRAKLDAEAALLTPLRNNNNFLVIQPYAALYQALPLKIYRYPDSIITEYQVLMPANRLHRGKQYATNHMGQHTLFIGARN
jgi:hypothetical protein